MLEYVEHYGKKNGAELLDWSPWGWGLNLKQMNPLCVFRQVDYMKFCLCQVRIYFPVIFSLVLSWAPMVLLSLISCYLYNPFLTP